MTPKKPAVVHAAGAALLAILTLATWLVGLQPSLNSRARYRDLVARRQTERQNLLQAQTLEDATKARLASLQDSLRQRPLILRGQDDLSKKLQEITELSAGAGLQLSSIEAGKADNFSRHGTVGIQIAARASLPSLWTFFHDLREKMPDVTVRSVDLTGRYANKDSVPGLTMALVWHTARTQQVAVR